MYLSTEYESQKITIIVTLEHTVTRNRVDQFMVIELLDRKHGRCVTNHN